MRFPLLDNPLDLKASMVIWTTTPWTLPANVGIALHPRFTYVAGQFMKDGQTETLIILKDLLDAFAQKTGWALAAVAYTHLDVYKRQLFTPIVGRLFMPFLGALLAELICARKDIMAAFKAGSGAALGMLTGLLLEFTCGLLIIAWFLSLIHI